MKASGANDLSTTREQFLCKKIELLYETKSMVLNGKTYRDMEIYMTLVVLDKRGVRSLKVFAAELLQVSFRYMPWYGHWV